MDRVINLIIDKVFNNFDFGYTSAVIILTYLLIKLIDKINGDRVVSVYQKRIILVLVIVLLAGIYILFGYDNKIALVNSAILSPVFWSWVLKPILKHFNLDYKQIDNTIL